MRKLPWVWLVALLCTALVFLFAFYQQMDREVVCLISFNYQIVSDKIVVNRVIPSLEEPPLVVLNLDISFYQPQNDDVDPVWADMFGGYKRIYYPKGVDVIGLLSKGVVLNLSHPYLGCEWVLFRVYPK